MKYNRGKIAKIIECQKFEMIDFYNACPFVFEGDYIDTRKREVVLWRSVGVVWKWLGGATLSEAGREFHRDHANVIHSIKAVINAYEGYGHPEIVDNIEKIKSCFPFNYYADEDIWVNYAKNLVRLDYLVGKML
jgi:hypothetical protein